MEFIVFIALGVLPARVANGIVISPLSLEMQPPLD